MLKNATEMKYQLVKLHGQMAMCLMEEIDPATVPEDVVWYPIYRHGDALMVSSSRTIARPTFGIVIVNRPMDFHNKTALPLFGNNSRKQTGVYLPIQFHTLLDSMEFPRQVASLGTVTGMGEIEVKVADSGQNAPLVEVIWTYPDDCYIFFKKIFRLEIENDGTTLAGYIDKGAADMEQRIFMEL